MVVAEKDEEEAEEEEEEEEGEGEQATFALPALPLSTSTVAGAVPDRCSD